MNKECIIVGGSPLVDKELLRKLNGDIIVVNNSFKYVPQARYFITMDFSYLNKIGMKTISEDYIAFRDGCFNKIFIVNPGQNLQYKNNKWIDVRWNLEYNLKDFDVVIKSNGIEGIGIDFNNFKHGNNSGFCAVQFALLMGYKTIYLLGLDFQMTEQTHFWGGYGEDICKFKTKLEGYYESFIRSLNDIYLKFPEINIFVCSKESRLINNLPYYNLNDKFNIGQ